MVDTSNPFIARWIPTPDESMLVIRFADPRGIDFPYLLSMIHDSFMSRANTIVMPGGKLDLAMQLIFTPMILQLMDRKRRAVTRRPNRPPRKERDAMALVSAAPAARPRRRARLRRAGVQRQQPGADPGDHAAAADVDSPVILQARPARASTRATFLRH